MSDVTFPMTLDVLLKAGQVSSAAGLFVDVEAFNYNIQGTIARYVGAVAQALADNDVNYVYLNNAGALVINTTGWPAAGDHVQLAKVTTSGGVISEIEDRRAWLSALTSSPGGLSNLVEDASPQLGGDLDCNGKDVDGAVNVTFVGEHDNGNSGTTPTVDWNDGQKQKITLSANATFTFTDPEGPCNVLLRVIRDGTAGRTITWPAGVHSPQGGNPLATASAVNLYAFYFDGTDYWLGLSNYAS